MLLSIVPNSDHSYSENLYENLLQFHVLDFFGDLLCVGLVLLDGVGHAAAHLLFFKKLPRDFTNLETVNDLINTRLNGSWMGSKLSFLALTFHGLFYHLLATLFPPTGPSASFPHRLVSNDWSWAAKWAGLPITSNSCLPNSGKI